MCSARNRPSTLCPNLRFRSSARGKCETFSPEGIDPREERREGAQ
jgi:hypothetical protein